jgi:hypothetical protein
LEEGREAADLRLSLTNTGEKTETVHAIVYAKNDSTIPPRRAISPPTVSKEWFGLANSKDGSLKAADIERVWKASGFIGARGSRLRKTWDVKLDPEETKPIEGAHELDDTSPHPQWKGKKLAQVGYTEYQLWLFTNDGSCFLEETYSISPNGTVKKTDSKPEAKKPPEPKADPVVKDTKPEEPKKPIDLPMQETTPKSKLNDQVAETHAANELRLAMYYLERNRRQDAKDKLNLILKKYPDTEAARKAQKMLKDLS